VADIELSELRGRYDGDLTLVDVRSRDEYSGRAGAHCDPRHGHIPGALCVPLERLAACESAEEVRALVAAPAGSEVVAYCHSGSRSAYAVHLLESAGYEARNYVGSWHEWSRDPSLPAATS
jgi:thiosulfate/3-mercaptopyruvate sulfurtransferase